MTDVLRTEYLVFMVARLAENLGPKGFQISFIPYKTNQEEKTDIGYLYWG
jgi:hypothetical protein